MQTFDSTSARCHSTSAGKVSPHYRKETQQADGFLLVDTGKRLDGRTCLAGRMPYAIGQTTKEDCGRTATTIYQAGVHDKTNVLLAVQSAASSTAATTQVFFIDHADQEFLG